jgi:hypothetical protein
MSDDRYADGRCGAQADGSACFRNGSSRYGGLCAQHGRMFGLKPSAAPPEVVAWTARHAKLGRCGSVDTVTGHACNQLVGGVGRRCGFHSEQALADAVVRRREILADKLEQAILRRRRVDDQIAALRSELEMLTPKTSKRALGDACEDTSSKQPEVRA